MYSWPLERFVVPIHINEVVKKPQAANLVSRDLGGRVPRYPRNQYRSSPGEDLSSLASENQHE